MTTSRIPAALDALKAACDAAVGATVTVVLGPPLSWDHVQVAGSAVSESQFLFVGASPGSDASATGQQDFNAAGAVSRDERFDINLTAYCWSGDADVKARRDEAFTLLAAVENALRSDPSLAGAVLYARVATVSDVAMRQVATGSDCLVEFQVSCRAYLD
jgi:hypothetical protein